MGLAGMPVFDARARNALTAEEATAYFAATATMSLSPLLRTGWWRDTVRSRARRLLVALLVWALVLVLHPWVIGVSPLPV